ncbi:hypothetical protein J2Y67_003790 [Neobacillus niacini]|nr:hypothetical protein [Neobacillus niacini]
MTTKPINTGTKFRLAKSKGSTLQMAAAGISAHGTRVPPPTQMAAICPRAVSVAAPLPIAMAKRWAFATCDYGIFYWKKGRFNTTCNSKSDFVLSFYLLSLTPLDQR